MTSAAGLLLSLVLNTAAISCLSLESAAKISNLIFEADKKFSGLTDLRCHSWLLPQSSSSSYSLSPIFFHTNFALPVVLCAPESESTNNYNINKSKTSSENEILHPRILGVQRFTRNCMSVFLHSDTGKDVINYLTSSRLIQPDKDYFFLLGASGVALNRKLQEPHFIELQYKAMIMIDNLEESNLVVKSYCKESANDGKTLFSFECPSIIHGRHFKASCTRIPAVVRPEIISKNGTVIQKGGGFTYEMFLEASKRYNFSFESEQSSSGGTSGVIRNGQWTGTIGDVVSGKFDVGLGLGITVDRNLAIVFSVPQEWYARLFYVKQPEFHHDWWAVLWPLQLSVWMASVGVLLVTLAAFYATAVQYTKTNPERKMSKLGILRQTFGGLCRTFVEQPACWTRWPGTRFRILIVLWSVFCLVLGTGYRSKLVSFLTFLDRQKIPTTHLELSISDYHLFFRYYGGVAYKYTKESSNPMHQRILAKSGLFNSTIDCMYALLLTPKNQRRACLDYEAPFELAVYKNATLRSSQQTSDLFFKSKDADNSFMIAWAFRKHSPWLSTFNKFSSHCSAGNLIAKWTQDDWHKSKVVGSEWLMRQEESKVKKKVEQLLEGRGGIGPKPLAKTSFAGLCILYVLGVLTAVMAFIGEVLTWKYFAYAWRCKAKCQERQRQEIRLKFLWTI